MIRMPLKKSLHIRDVGYDITDGRLGVTMHNGRVFKYHTVREELVHHLIRSGKISALRFIESYTGQYHLPFRHT